MLWQQMVNHTVAVLKVKEDYKNLIEELQDIINEVEHLKFVDFNGIMYDIDWYLGGDWKFLVMVAESAMPYPNFLVFGVNASLVINLMLPKNGQ